MWCDYFTDENPIAPTPIDDKPDANIYSEITCSGSKAELKVNGGYKKFTCTFYRDGEPIEFDKNGRWAYEMDGKDISDLLDIQTPETTTSLSDNQIKVKFIGGDDYISTILTIKYITLGGLTSQLEVAVTSL